MDPLITRFLLKSKGLSFASLARTYRNPRTGNTVTPAAIRQVVDGACRSQPIERLVADALDMPIHQVFPDLYSKSGRPLPSQRKPTRTTDEMLDQLRQVLSRAEPATKHAA